MQPAFVCALLGVSLSTAHAFSLPGAMRLDPRRPSAALSSAVVGRTPSCVASAIKVSGTNFKVTDALKEYADTKLNKPLDTYAPILASGEVEVHLKVESRGLHDTEHKGKEAHIAAASVLCVDKHVINVHAENDDMYASLDELSDRLTRSLRKYKEKRIVLKETRKRASKGELESDALDDDDDDE